MAKFLQPITFIIIAVLARVLPHPPNFTPIAAMALFGGAYLNKKQSLSLLLAVMVISDAIIGFDGFTSRLTVYSCFMFTVLLGVWLKNHRNATNIIFATLYSSIIFFLITNASVWAFGTMYAKTFSGLIESYTLAIPFFRNSILGDLFYTGIFFGGYEFIRNQLVNYKLKIVN